jgi:hypothetical protein
MVAVPDFEAGAMENWGLVMYREQMLLYSPLTTTADMRMSVVEVIVHELAHQVSNVSLLATDLTVVWQLDDHELVGGSVAERRICHLSAIHVHRTYLRREKWIRKYCLHMWLKSELRKTCFILKLSTRP